MLQYLDGGRRLRTGSEPPRDRKHVRACEQQQLDTIRNQNKEKHANKHETWELEGCDLKDELLMNLELN